MQTPTSSAPSNLRAQLFGTSFIILFLELALIRFLPSQIMYFGYFANFILLATFVGIGLGTLLANRLASLRSTFPWMVLVVVLFSASLGVTAQPGSGGEIHFTSTAVAGGVLPDYLVIPFFFILVAATFVPIAQRLGRLLDAGRPLTVYTWDILGSLAGVVAFAAAAYLQTPPVVWFAVIGGVYLLLPGDAPFLRRISVLAIAFLLLITCSVGVGQRWSPYQKISVQPISTPSPDIPTRFRLSVNNVVHQDIIQDSQNVEGFYRFPYEGVENTTYKRVLIIGAGSGNDVAVALNYGAERIDAVEIDPVLVDIGRRLHPNHPYDDPRVVTYIDDGRAFLQKTWYLRSHRVRPARLPGARRQPWKPSARELPLHGGSVPGSEGAPGSRWGIRSLQLLPQAVAGRETRWHGHGGVRTTLLRLLRRH